MNHSNFIYLTMPVILILAACTANPGGPNPTVTATTTAAKTSQISTPAITVTAVPTYTPAPAPTRVPSITISPFPTMDFAETDYSHFFDAYPPMMHISYTPHTLGYEYWTPIVNGLVRKLDIPGCKDWVMVQVIDTRWDDIFEHYEVTIVDNGWTLLSSTKNQTSVVDGQTYNLGVLHYDVGGDKERIILVFDSQPELGNPYYILFFYDER